MTTTLNTPARRGLRADRVRKRMRQLGWASIPVWSLGLLAFVPFLRLALARHRARDWGVFGAYLAVDIAEMALFSVGTPDSAAENLAGGIAVALMVSAAVHTLVAYRPGSSLPPVAAPPSFEQRNQQALATARSRIVCRREARELAERDPVLARELRIGRPDLPREYDDGGLVDVNNVPSEVLASDLGLTAVEATAVMAARQRLGQFSSAEELSVYAGLPPDRLDDIRDLMWFG